MAQSAPVAPPPIALRSKNLGDLGQKVMEFALTERLGTQYCEKHVQGPQEIGKGADYVIEDLKLAIEVKFWIRSGDGMMTDADIDSHVKQRFKDYHGEWRRYLVMMGKRPKQWFRIAQRSRKCRIRPFSIPYDSVIRGMRDMDVLDIAAESRGFVVEEWARRTYEWFRPSLLMVLTLALGEYTRMDDDEWREICSIVMANRKVDPLGNWKRRGRRAERDERGIVDGLLQAISANAGARTIGRSRSTANNRLREWQRDGTWSSIIRRLGELRFGSLSAETRQSLGMPNSSQTLPEGV